MPTADELRRTHPLYDAMIADWTYVRNLETGDYLKGANINRYLVRRKQGEARLMYQDRLDNLDPDLLFNEGITKLVGELFAAEAAATYTFQPEEAPDGLGSHEEAGTVAHRLWHNVDGDGTNWRVQDRQLARKVILYQTPWVLVEGPPSRTNERGERVLEGEARVKLIDPHDVIYPVWDRDTGALIEAKVRHGTYEGDSSLEDAKQIEYYTIYRREGFERYSIESEAQGGQEAALEASGMYTLYSDQTRSQQVLPLFPVVLPFDQYLAYLLARKAIAVMGKESERDNLLRTAATPRIVERNDNVESKTADDMEAGHNFHIIPKDASLEWISPPTDPAELLTAVIEQKTRRFREAAMDLYEQRAREVTATEMRYNRMGRSAFLGLMLATLREADNQRLLRLEQIYFPDQPDLWGQAQIDRPDEFEPVDEAERARGVRETYFGPDAVPADEDTRADAAEVVAQHYGLAYDRDRAVVLFRNGRGSEPKEMEDVT